MLMFTFTSMFNENVELTIIEILTSASKKYLDKNYILSRDSYNKEQNSYIHPCVM
jgi:hypothetical protein